MKSFLIFGILGTLVSLYYTLNLFINGESLPRILNETFILWIVTIVFYVIHFTGGWSTGHHSKSKKKKKYSKSKKRKI